MCGGVLSFKFQYFQQEWQLAAAVLYSAPSVPQPVFTITEKAFSWLKAPTNTFTFKTLLRHYAKWALTPWSLNVKLGPRRKGHKGRAVWLA